MDVKAKASHIKMSPRKVRLVVDVVRGMDVAKAKDQLQFIHKAAVRPVLKLLNSAIANATNNFELKEDNLYVKEIRVDQGPTLKRWRPRAFGRAAPIRKRTSHISIILGERVESKKEAKKEKKAVLPKPKVVSDYKSVTKGEGDKKRAGKDDPSTRSARSGPSGKTKDIESDLKEEKKAEPFDKARVGKQRHQENIDKKQLDTKRGFLKKMFNRKAG